MTPWWEKNRGRYEIEIETMSEKFPQFQLGKATAARSYHGWRVVKESQLFWIGNLKTVSGNIYTPVITYPDHYPGMEIRTFIIEPHISSTNHRCRAGSLCLYSNDHGGNGQGKGMGMSIRPP